MDYAPRPSVLSTLSSVDFVAVIGPTAAGKTTIINRATAMNDTVHLVVVTTSRDPRPGEQNGVDYHFARHDAMVKDIADRRFVQVAPSILGPLYATKPEAYATEGYAVMPVIVQGLAAFAALPFKRMRRIVILPPSWEVWNERINSHSFTPEQLQRRLVEAKVSLEYAAVSCDTAYIMNDNLSQATEEFLSIITEHKPGLTRVEGQMIAKKLLIKLEH
jgi:guanylate kinase